jgi:hypothetical protein
MTKRIKQKVRAGDVWLCHDVFDKNHEFVGFVNTDEKFQTIEDYGDTYPLDESYWGCLTVRIVKGKGKPFRPPVKVLDW